MSKVAAIILTAVVTCLLTSAFFIGSACLAYWYFMGDPPSFAVDVRAPEQVHLEEEFELVVSVHNPSEEAITLGSIDVYDSLVDGFEIISMTPEPDEVSTLFDFHTSYFSHKLLPSETLTVTYVLKAKAAGVWVGDIDCCTPAERFVTVSKAIHVLPPEAASGSR